MGALFHALGRVESNHRDRAVGAAGEVSRYQLTPANWRRLALPGEAPHREADARRVALRFWDPEFKRYHQATGNWPSYQDCYALWHRPGTFRRVGYRLGSLPAVIQRRCEAFATHAFQFDSRRGPS
ncbi:MAG: lysozyme family protein [Limisphaerales bacterium]